ncbi:MULTISPECIES: NAD(P)/FAD-dependent oxidoreductase [Roseobacteraceae]|uniref:Rhodocoxin reductase n=1 Tax=Pseudosulfitobacter pseudonitzschiae TaxID=1402135 RepID=A0A221K8Q0_9RHOB|nr:MULTISPECIES: FAD-dependent oxidoreductase [Roseobacteraceae]ASM75227.1 rhodocoxin reductase [Pseudosulfitobacter pseudonitzschiae]
MTSGRIVIVGAGQGGLQAAVCLRQEGYLGPITLIGSENHLPYQRPPLSKAYLKTGQADSLRLRPLSFFNDQNITLLLGNAVTNIDPATQQVAHCSGTLVYDHLILAMGTRNLRPDIPGLEHALDLRTLDDAERLRLAMIDAHSVAVIGGGFIGLEFAAVARGLGLQVTVAEAAPRLMARVVSPQMSEHFLKLHRAMGTTIMLNASVSQVNAKGIVACGSTVKADLVVLAAGVRPNTELAQQAGLAIDNGVRTNAHLLTSDPAISAIGDCAAFPDPATGRLVRLESVQATTDHARLIARRLTKGSSDKYTSVPWFWSDQAENKLQIAGFATPGDVAIMRADGAVFCFEGDYLSAVETVNDPRTHMQARQLLVGGARPTRDILDNQGYEISPIQR